MKYRELGTTGIRISEIGFGAWGIGGDSYGATEDEESKQTLLLALECGINFFDTSDIYGSGHSEELIGEALAPFRDRIVLATKGGALPHRGILMPQNFSPGHLEKALEASLKRLRADCVDLYQLHSPAEADLTDEVLKTLDNFKEKGKARLIGVSARSPSAAAALLARYSFASIQVNFNMIDQRALEVGLFALCSKAGVGVIARTPFNFGFLAGGIRNLNFSNTDHRANWPKEQLERWMRAISLFEELYKDGRMTKAQLALQFCLAFGPISSVIPGMLTRREVEENVCASDLTPLTPAELSSITEIYKLHTFVDPSLMRKTTQLRYNQGD